MGYSLHEIAEKVGARVVGQNEGRIEITGVTSIATAKSSHLVFVDDSKFLDAALESNAGAVFAGEFAAQCQSSKPLLICAQPRLGFARAAKLLSPPSERMLGVHPTAVVHQTATLGLGVSVGPHAAIQKAVQVGSRTHIGAGVSIGASVIIGSECVLESNVCIYSGTALGDRVVVHAGAVLGSDGFGFVCDQTTGSYEKFPQIGRLEIHDDVEIGANSTIDRGALDATVIGKGTKLDNLVHVGHNVRIGKNVVIAAQTGVSGSSVIADNVVVAGQVGIADHVTIEEGAILGAQCGVPSGKTIRGKGIVFWGTPARPLSQYLKELASMARLAKKR